MTGDELEQKMKVARFWPRLLNSGASVTDEVYGDIRVIRSWIGGPMEGSIWLLHPSKRAIVIVDHGKPLGRYVRCNIGWAWIEGAQ